MIEIQWAWGVRYEGWWTTVPAIILDVYLFFKKETWKDWDGVTK